MMCAARAAMVKPYQLSLLPVVIAGILVTTALPIALGAPVGWRTTFNLRDFIQNLLLYAPLGIVLWRWPPTRVFLAALVLSGVIEATQVWSVGRYASVYDVVANSLGTLIGALVWRRFADSRPVGAETARVNGRVVGITTTLTGILVAAWAIPGEPADLSLWDPGYTLLLGNEVTPDRPWEGTIRALALIPTALSPAEIRALTTARASVHRRPAQPGAYEMPQPVALRGGPGIVLPEGLPHEFGRAAMRRSAFTVAARISVTNVVQGGPARIVSFSADTLHRNFDLGQEGRKLIFRVRTPVSGANGNEFRTTTQAILRPGREVMVVATYDGSTARIYVDGALHGRSNLAAAGCWVRGLCDSVAPTAWAVLGGLLAIIALAMVPARGTPQVFITAVLAGVVALALPRVVPFGRVPIATQPWLQLTTLFGAATIGLARVAATRRATSDRPDEVPHRPPESGC